MTTQNWWQNHALQSSLLREKDETLMKLRVENCPEVFNFKERRVKCCNLGHQLVSIWQGPEAWQPGRHLATSRRLLRRALRIECLSGVLSANPDDDESGKVSVAWFVNFCGAPNIELGQTPSVPTCTAMMCRKRWREKCADL
jgi:hypothetical protein